METLDDGSERIRGYKVMYTCYRIFIDKVMNIFFIKYGTDGGDSSQCERLCHCNPQADEKGRGTVVLSVGSAGVWEASNKRDYYQARIIILKI